MIDAGAVLNKMFNECEKPKKQILQELSVSRQSFNQYLKKNPDKMQLNNFQKFVEYFGYELKVEKKV